MSRRSELPVIIGCYDKADKCAIVCETKNLGKHSLLVCRLKEMEERGSEVEMENVKEVIAHLHFCKIEAAKAFRDSMIELVREWEDEDED